MRKLLKITILSLFSVLALYQSHAQCSTEAREALGGTTALMLYNTYIAVGSIADMYEKNVIDASSASEMATEQTQMIEIVANQLNNAQKDKSTSLTADDKAYLSEVIEVMKNLKQQAAALQKYIGKKGEADLNNYSLNRDAAWKKIEKLLGL